MKVIQQAMLEQIYLDAYAVARKNNQTVGEKNDYYLTVEQLEHILKEFEE